MKMISGDCDENYFSYGGKVVTKEPYTMRCLERTWPVYFTIQFLLFAITFQHQLFSLMRVPVHNTTNTLQNTLLILLLVEVVLLVVTVVNDSTNFGQQLTYYVINQTSNFSHSVLYYS